MKSMFSRGAAVFVSAFGILNGPSVAGPGPSVAEAVDMRVEVINPHSSIENKCRAAVRGELKGPNCAKIWWINDQVSPSHPCRINRMEQTSYSDKVVQCVARGGPGHAAR